MWDEQISKRIRAEKKIESEVDSFTDYLEWRAEQREVLEKIKGDLENER